MRTIILVTATLLFSIAIRGQGVWTQKNDFPSNTGKSLAISFSIDSLGYCGLGDSFQNDFWKYNPFTDSWTQLSPFPGVPRIESATFVIGTKAYIIGGFIGNNTNTDEVWEYDAVSDSWSQKQNFPGGARTAAFGFSVFNKGYVGSGFQNLLLQDIWEYSPLSDTWTQKNNFPGDGRVYAAAFVIGNKAYIGTGYTDLSATNDFWEYDPLSDLWVQKAPFAGGARQGAVAFSIGTKGYVSTGKGSVNSQVFNDLWEYDPSNDSWIQKNSFGASRVFGVVFVINNKGYAGLGSNMGGTYHWDFWEYDPNATSILEFDYTKSGVIAFPNPASESIQIESSHILNATAIYISNSLGELTFPLILDYNEKKIDLDVSCLRRGVYFINLQTKEGVIVRKFIKL